MHSQQFSRAFNRVLLRDPATAGVWSSAMEPRRVSVLNIGLGGASLYAELPLGEVPEVLELEFDFPGAKAPLRCSAQLRYVLASERIEAGQAWLHGARFQRLKGPAAVVIEEYIASHPDDVY